MVWGKVKNWWKNNQERNSERYTEREELKEELKEISKDLDVILNSPAGKIPNYALQRAIFIQNTFLQRKLNQATEGLKLATIILASATIVFAWVTILDSQKSNYIFQTLRGIMTVLVFSIMVCIIINIIWRIIKFIFRRFRRKK